MPTRWFVFCTMLATALAVPQAGARAAEIKVFSDTPLSTALQRIAPAFQRDSGYDVQYEFGVSPVIEEKASNGEPGDVIVIQPNFINDLVNQGKIAAAEYPTVARVGIGLFTRADLPTPDISTAEAFKRALLGADSVAFSNLTAGNYFATVLERLGVAGTLQGRVIRAKPTEVVERVVQGKGNDIGVMAMTLIIADKRLKLIGALPPEYQSYLVYAAAPMVNARSPKAAEAFVRFLTSRQSHQEFVASGAN